MSILVAEIPEVHLPAAIAALTALSPEVEILSPKTPSSEDAVAAEAELAQRVVEAVRPTPSQPMRAEALRKLLSGHDTFMNQQGEADPALRNAMGAISKALKPVFQHDKSIQRLARSKKHYQDGYYMGTIYQVTPLGKRVRDLLLAEDSI